MDHYDAPGSTEAAASEDSMQEMTDDEREVEGFSDLAVRRLLREWRQADLLTEDQAAALASFHAEHHQDAERSRGYRRMVAVLSSLGGILVGAGILLVVGSNWQGLTSLQKTTLAMVAVVAMEAAGYWIRYQTSFRRTGEAILFVGAVAYGGAVFLAAQVYNRPLDDPNLFVFWLLPVFPIAYVVGSRLIMALSILVTFGVIGYRIDDWILDAEALFPILTTYLLIGAALLSLGGVQRDVGALRYLAPPWEWLGTTAMLATLFIASFEFVGGSNRWKWIDGIAGSLLAILVVAGILAAAGVVARTALRNAFDREVAFTASIVGIAVVSAAVFVTVASFPTPALFAATNVLLLALLITMVIGGIATNRQALVNVALVVFGITVLARYIEIGAGMLGTGAAMIVGGALLILLGVGLESARRKLVEAMHPKEAST